MRSSGGSSPTATIESEERSGMASQTIELAGWSELTQRPFEGASHRLDYAPYGSSFHSVTWDLNEHDVSHLRIRVLPAKRGQRPPLTAITLRRGRT